jgi:sugar O-acyltransferase (sialic acid O-acetyltransferase NeuD family)
MKVIFIGANNPETLRMIRACQTVNPNFEVVGFLDNNPQKMNTVYHGYPILGGTSSIKSLGLDLSEVRFINLITRDTVTRYKTSLEVSSQGGKFANFMHPSVNLEYVKLGTGIYVQENVVLQAEVHVGNNSSIHIGTLVGHESKIGNSVFIAHGCNISGNTIIEDGVQMGTGVSSVPRIKIGKWSIIGAGAVVIKDVPPYSVVVGNPGKVIKSVQPEFDSGDIF